MDKLEDMREMLLSFKPEIFELIRSGKKIYEYRYQFSDQPVRAYMYVSLPVQQIVGYLELGRRISLEEWKEKYKDNGEVKERIDEYIARNNKYVMPINSFHMTKPILLCNLKKDIKNFIIPQSYYYLDKFPELLEYIRENAIETNEVMKNTFYDDNMDNICVRKYE